jgi:Ca2+:H+ antiporter
MSGDEADAEADKNGNRPKVRDFEQEHGDASKSPERRRSKKHKKHVKRKSKEEKPTEKENAVDDTNEEVVKLDKSVSTPESNEPHVGFADEVDLNHNEQSQAAKRPWNIRQLSSRPIMPTVPNPFAHTVFSSQGQNRTESPTVRGAAMHPKVQAARLRRTTSLPERLNQTVFTQASAARQIIAPGIPPRLGPDSAVDEGSHVKGEGEMSRTAAVVMLLLSTGLVAVCAEFLVDVIPHMNGSGVGQAFIALIILPIVGNAAEHVTAVTVAAKNKMDLAIGVAVGSSIQIGKFVSTIVTNMSILTMYSNLRNSTGRYSWMDHEPRDDTIFQYLRNRISFCNGICGQLSCPRWP